MFVYSHTSIQVGDIMRILFSENDSLTIDDSSGTHFPNDDFFPQ